MSTADTNVNNLIINVLSKQAYEGISNPSDTELYFVTDEVISSTDVTDALGYTPYDSSNPNGYTTNTGTVTSVNNVSPVNGNVSLTIPIITDTYSGTSSDGMSGKAVKSAIDTAISSTYKAAGSIAFASRPTPGKTYEGNVYNIEDAFTTDSTFVEGSGKSYPAGTNIVCINTSGTTYKWDVLSGMVDLSGYQLANTAVTHTASTSVGSGTKGVYIASNGAATEMTYSLSKSVPSDAVFTDTKNTAGSTDTSSKIFLVGATSQAADPQTYSHDTAFVDTSGQINSANPAASTSSTVVATTKWVTDKGYLTSVPDIASNKVTAMTGYSKPSTTSAIATTDSLNTAIGKLEKALDGKASSDTKVTQALKSDNNTYRLLATPANQDATTTTTSTFSKGININPSLGILTVQPQGGQQGNLYEGGEIQLQANTGDNTKGGIKLDNYQSNLRILGIASADGTSKTGTGTTLVIDPWAKTITGGYTFTGNVTGNCSGSSGSCTGNAATATTASSCSGNAATATTLQTARNINGTSFNGSADITTTNWGTARNISISDSDGTNTGTAVSVNGSQAYTLKLPSTIKASITGNCSGSSGSCTGNAATATTAEKVNKTAGATPWNAVYVQGQNDYFRIRFDESTGNSGWAEIATADDGNEPIYVRQYTGVFTTVKRTATLLDASGNTSFPGTVTATSFSGPLTGNVTGNCSGSSGSCTGNAATATILQTTRSINGTNFNGSANITTANWGTARNISISDSDGTNTGTATSVNGSQAYTLKLPATIKASITGNCSGSSGSCTGNAATATTLQNTRTINGTNFNGSANITTASWGTARNISISDSDGTNTGTAVSVNGSGNATLKLPATIKASITGNCSGSSGSCTGNAATATKATQDSDGNAINSTYLKKSGGTMTGSLTFANGKWNSVGDDASIGDQNIGGHLCVKPNASTFDNSGGIQFMNSSSTALVQLNASSGALTSSGSLGVSNNACKMVYNSTTQALEFNFA